MKFAKTAGRARSAHAAQPSRQPRGRAARSLPGVILAAQRTAGNRATTAAIDNWLKGAAGRGPGGTPAAGTAESGKLPPHDAVTDASSALRHALSDRGEALAPSVMTQFARLFSAFPTAQTAEPGRAGEVDGWAISAADSPAERAAREMADRSVSAPVPGRPPSVPARFADVRVHRGPAAARAARALMARAFTIGHHIYFAAGQYDPDSIRGRRLLGHELAHVRHADASGPAKTPATVIMRESWSEGAAKWYDQKKWDIYRSMIAGLKSAKNASSGLARSQVPLFPQWMQGAVTTLIDINNFVADLIIGLLLAIVGLAVGFVEGIVGLVTGLIKLVYKLIWLVLDMIKAMLGKPEDYRDDINALINAIKNIGPGIKQLVADWIERYKKASLEEQVLMGGELVGQIEAFIATFALAGTKAGKVASLGGGAGAVRVSAGGEAVLQPAQVLVAAPVAAKVTAEGAVVSQQLMLMSGQGPGGAPPASTPPSGGKPPPSPVDEARTQVERDIAQERTRVAGRKSEMAPEEWARGRGGLTKRLYNLLERRAVLARMKAFPGRTFLEQAEITGVRSGGKLTTTAEISQTGKGRIADILELNGQQATLEDLKSASTQLKSVEGGMSSSDVEAEFRSTSEIAKQHEVEQQVIAEARRTGGQVIVTGRDPISGATVERALDPDSITSRVTDYTDIGNN